MRRPLPSMYSRDARDGWAILGGRLGAWKRALGDPRVEDLEARFMEVARELFVLDDELQAQCQDLLNHPDREAMHDGVIPFPMEPLARFPGPACTCGYECGACRGLAPRYFNEGDCAGAAEHTCMDPCPMHGDDKIDLEEAA